MVVDAVASRREEDKKIAIERAIQEGILVTTAEAVLFELTLILPIHVLRPFLNW